MNCPYCNSPVLLNDVAGNPWYQCGTTKTFRSASCVDREPLATELRNALARIRRLEEAVQRVEDAAHSIQDWGGTVLGDALDELEKAKEAKP